MVESQGWVKLHRSILEWEWYRDANTKSLFFHLIIKANRADKKYQGTMVKRGELIVGRKSLSVDLGLSEQQVRTSLNKLKSTNEITIKTTNKYSVVSIVNYDFYQISESNQPATQPTDNQQVTNKQPTSNQQITTNKNIKNNKKERNKESIQLDSGENEFPPTPPKKKSIEEKKESFKKRMEPYRDKYPREMLNDFWRYWTEIGENDKKMRFEKEKTFGMDRRLITWKNNESKFNNGKNDKRSHRHEPSKQIDSYGQL